MPNYVTSSAMPLEVLCFYRLPACSAPFAAEALKNFRHLWGSFHLFPGFLHRKAQGCELTATSHCRGCRMLSNSTLVGLRGEALIPIPDRSNKEVVNRDTPKVGEFWAINEGPEMP